MILLAWERPAFAWALLLPVVFYLLLRARATPLERATGTVALWKLVGANDPRAHLRSRATPPRWAWPILAALVLGSLALGGPRLARARGAALWTAVLDTSPSTGLPWRADGAAGAAAGKTRLEVALASAHEWLRDHAAASDRVRWIAAGREPLELGAQEMPPESWFVPLGWPEEEPRWELHDEQGTVWISDDPRLTPERAGLFASGGAAVPGAVAADGRTRVEWDGERLARADVAGAPRELAVLAAPGAALPAVLERVARAWATPRGFAVVREESERTALTLELAESNGKELIELDAGRDGWSARGRIVAGGAGALGAGEDWLAVEHAGERRVLVRAEHGRIRVAWRELGEPSGDPAAFAVSWARLLDRWALPAPEVVALAERVAKGEPRVRPPAAPGRRSAGDADERPARVDAALALAAALLALLGVSTWRRTA